MTINTNLEKLYQSYPEGKFRFQTIEISHSSFNTKYLYKTSGFGDDLDFRLEDNSVETFLASGFSLSDPSNESVSNSLLSLSFGVYSLIEINEIIDALETSDLNFLEPIKIIYRIYHSDDVDVGPSTDPTKTYVESMSLNPASGANLKLTTTNNLRFSTGAIYSIIDFPGLITNG